MPESFTYRFMDAWRARDLAVLERLIHPEADLETAMAAVHGLSRGRDAAVTALSAMRDSLYDVSVVRVEAVSPTEALVHGVARLPARPHGHSYGTICWRIELRDGMLWRSRIVS
jgi:hypothetical protein